MRAEDGSTRRSTDPDDYQEVARPVAAMPKHFPPGFATPLHRHRRAQLTFAVAGTMAVTTGAGIWVVPPQRAVWIPADTEHRVRMLSTVEMRALYVEPNAAPHLPTSACVVAVPPLLRELIVEATRLPLDYAETGRDGRIMALILDEIRALASLPLHLPMPRDPRIGRVCERLAADPAQGAGLAVCAREAGLSQRNFVRLFRRDTGLSFGAWLRQALLLAALPRLAAGEPVTTVALDLGYDSPSAFTAMFRRTLGTPPSRYFAPG
jgi:AraC-like DNA-binding protein/mannose-6-phosphate isomerase-like protein (cupin superfamily)